MMLHFAQESNRQMLIILCSLVLLIFTIPFFTYSAEVPVKQTPLNQSPSETTLDPVHEQPTTVSNEPEMDEKKQESGLELGQGGQPSPKSFLKVCSH